MPKVTIDTAKLTKAAQSAFKETVLLMGTKFTEVISEPGAFDGFPGDIVDTGRLRASQQTDFISPNEAQISFNVEYAIFVHEGYTLRNGGSQPGRPWTSEGLKRFDAQKAFGLLLAAKLK